MVKRLERTTCAMMQQVAHRGPDASGVWCQGPLGLGHVRLSILDLSPRGNQPFISHDMQGILIYNGEVYNFAELRVQLEAEGAVFRSTSDTEVVLEALHRWGPERAVPRFNGMFAFAYYDLRSRELWLARDRLGIKPLYIAQTPQALVFGSEIKALLRHPAIPNRPDLHALTVHLLCESIEGDWTPFESIRAIRPGCLVRWNGERRADIEYFDPLNAVRIERLAAASKVDANEFVEQFAEAFQQSVSLHMVSDAPLAAMCSGGVDSSLIAAFAHDQRPDLTGYVADLKGTVSEGAAAQRMGRHLNVRIRQVDVDQTEYLRLLPWAVWHNDQPNHFPHDAAFLAVARACRGDGIKVLLTGEGSDELFGGYPWQEATWRMYRRRRWTSRWLPGEGRLDRFWRGLGKLASAPRAAVLRQPFQSVDDTSRVVGHSTHRSTESYQYGLASFGGQRMLRHEEIFARLDSIRPIEERAFLARSIDDMYGYLRMLLQRNDRMGMAASIESRFPFLENRLIDFALHLPFLAKYRQGTAKWIVKQLAVRRLPRETVFARKIGFSVPESIWMPGLSLMENGWLAEVLKWDAKYRRTIVGRIGESPRLSYLLLCSEIWGRLYFGGSRPDEISGQLLSLASVKPRAEQPLPKPIENARQQYAVAADC